MKRIGIDRISNWLDIQPIAGLGDTGYATKAGCLTLISGRHFLDIWSNIRTDTGYMIPDTRFTALISGRPNTD